MDSLQIKLEIFEGPFDVLLSLIKKNKIDIYNVSISKITYDYLAYIENMKNTNMDNMSQFILMASILLEIKTKSLLPKVKKEDLEEIDLEKELVNKLIEYKKYKMIAEELSKKDIFSETVVFRTQDEKIFEIIKNHQEESTEDIIREQGIDLNTLYNIFNEVIQRKEDKRDKIRSDFNSIKKPLYNINDKIQYIKDLIFFEKEISFKNFLSNKKSKAEVIVNFLAVLELIKIKYVKVFQSDLFNDLIISKKDDKDE